MTRDLTCKERAGAREDAGPRESRGWANAQRPTRPAGRPGLRRDDGPEGHGRTFPRTLPFPHFPFRRIIARLFVMGGIGVQLPTGWQVSLLGRQAPVTPVVQLRYRNSRRCQSTLGFPRSVLVFGVASMHSARAPYTGFRSWSLRALANSTQWSSPWLAKS
jgi:hypothetical protein